MKKDIYDILRYEWKKKLFSSYIIITLGLIIVGNSIKYSILQWAGVFLFWLGFGGVLAAKKELKKIDKDIKK